MTSRHWQAFSGMEITEWDNNPMHRDSSEAIANEIKKLIPLNKEMTALEYGE